MLFPNLNDNTVTKNQNITIPQEPINYVHSRNLNTICCQTRLYKNTHYAFANTFKNYTKDKIKFFAESIKITSTDFQNATNILELIKEWNARNPATDENNTINITLLYITKGFSFLKTFCKINNLPRPFPDIENILKTTNTECIIVPHPDQPKNYYIFVTQVSAELLDNILLLYPYFCNASTPDDFLDLPESVQNVLNDYLTKIIPFLTTAEKTPEEITAYLTEWYDKTNTITTDLQQQINKTLFLQNFCNKDQQLLLGTYQQNISDLENTIAEYYKQITNYQTQLTQLHRKTALMHCIDETAVKTFFNILELFPQIQIETLTPKEITIKISGTLTNYDVDIAETCLKNPDSVHNRTIINIASYCNISVPIIQNLIKDIFIRKKYVFIIEQNFRIELSNPNRLCSIAAIQAHIALNNPHILYFNCWDAARTNFYTNIETKNFEGAFAALVYATQQLTFEDIYVFRRFIEDKFYTYFKHKTLLDTTTNTQYSLDDLVNLYTTQSSEPETKIE